MSQTELTESIPQRISRATEEQVRQVFAWVLEGKGQDEIEAAIVEKWPDAIVGDIALAVTQRLQNCSRFTPEVVRGMCIEATREIYRRAVLADEFGVALRAIKQLWEMVR